MIALDRQGTQQQIPELRTVAPPDLPTVTPSGLTRLNDCFHA